MSPETYALMERLHGHLALLGLAVLLHPVFTLRRPGITRWTIRTADLGAALLTLPFVMGWLIYPTYRRQVKPTLLTELPFVAARFETKEHLAAMTVALAISGALVLRLDGRDPLARRAARALLLAAWTCGACTGLLGLYVSGGAHPGW